MYPLYNTTIQDKYPEELKKALAEIKRLSEEVKLSYQKGFRDGQQNGLKHQRTGGGY